MSALIVELKNGTTIRSQTGGNGDAGDIRIDASDHITLSDRFTFLGDPATISAYTRPTGLFTNSTGASGFGNLGNAGAIVLNTPRLEMTGGARLDSTTQSNGHGGSVTITSDSITISGERPFGVPEQELFGLGSSKSSGIFTRTVGSEFCSGSCGNAGTINIGTG